MKNNKQNKGCLVFILGFLAVLGYIFVYSNPASCLMARKTAKNLIAEKYPDYEIVRTRYNIWGTGDLMLVYLEISDSPDSQFIIFTDMLGNYESDTYERDVTEKLNVITRLRNQYHEKLKTTLEDTLSAYGKYHINSYLADIPKDICVIDKQYTDVELNEISLKCGGVDVYIDADTTKRQTSQLAKDIKKVMEENNIGFWTIQINTDSYDWYLIK